jgi:hypothetical protein
VAGSWQKNPFALSLHDPQLSFSSKPYGPRIGWPSLDGASFDVVLCQ